MATASLHPKPVEPCVLRATDFTTVADLDARVKTLRAEDVPVGIVYDDKRVIMLGSDPSVIDKMIEAVELVLRDSGSPGKCIVIDSWTITMGNELISDLSKLENTIHPDGSSINPDTLVYPMETFRDNRMFFRDRSDLREYRLTNIDRDEYGDFDLQMMEPDKKPRHHDHLRGKSFSRKKHY
jgi:hypothetical protein